MPSADSSESTNSTSLYILANVTDDYCRLENFEIVSLIRDFKIVHDDACHPTVYIVTVIIIQYLRTSLTTIELLASLLTGYRNLPTQLNLT